MTGPYVDLPRRRRLVLAMRKGGWPVASICEELGLSRKSVYRDLQVAGYRPTIGLVKPHATDILARHAAGESVLSIAVRIGVRTDAINRFLVTQGVKAPRVARRFTPTELEVVRNRLEQGTAAWSISIELGRNAASVYSLIRREGWSRSQP